MVDEQLKPILARLNAAPPLSALPLDLLRRTPLTPGDPATAPVAAAFDRTIRTPDGELPVRIYTPRASAGALPLLVFFHGGGFVVGGLETHDLTCRHISLKADCIVMAVDYRLAPEHKFPAAPNDALAAVRWAGEHAAQIGADGSRIAVGGDSAGGNLAAVTALRVRDEGGPKLSGQLLIYPMTDYPKPGTASLLEYGEGYFLSRGALLWFYEQYLNSETDAGHVFCSPLKAKDLRGLPPALVITAEYDPLRDEGEAYAARLRRDGVATESHRYDGMIHGFFGMAEVSKSDLAIRAAAQWLKGVLGAA